MSINIGIILLLSLVFGARPALARDVPREQSPLRSIDSLINGFDSNTSEPVLLRAVVTLNRDQALYVQDQTGALLVHPLNAPPLALGDEVELEGFYDREHPPGVLQHATVRRLWAGSTPIPLSLRPEQAAEGAYDYRLVETEGRLLKKTVSGNYFHLLLEGDRQIFAARLALSSSIDTGNPVTGRVEDGSTLRLVGVCAPSPNPNGSVAGAFVILLRSMDDIRIISPPPWWSPRHITFLAIGAAVLLLVLYRLRILFLRQQFQAIVDERLRIAREMHDTLAQGFAGLTYQLEGLSRELGPAALNRSTGRQLALALQLARHSREEAHRSIFALRSLTQVDRDLAGRLAASVDFMISASNTKLRASVLGRPFNLSDDVTNNLLRIGQEAIANAIRHSSGSEITATFRFVESCFALEIRDNGCGFDVERAKAADAGHFGITGMKERAQSIGALLDIRSAPGNGTVVSVSLKTRTRLSASPTARSLRRERRWKRLTNFWKHHLHENSSSHC